MSRARLVSGCHASRKHHHLSGISGQATVATARDVRWTLRWMAKRNHCDGMLDTSEGDTWHDGSFTRVNLAEGERATPHAVEGGREGREHRRDVLAEGKDEARLDDTQLEREELTAAVHEGGVTGAWEDASRFVARLEAHIRVAEKAVLWGDAHAVEESEEWSPGRIVRRLAPLGEEAREPRLTVEVVPEDEHASYRHWRKRLIWLGTPKARAAREEGKAGDATGHGNDTPRVGRDCRHLAKEYIDWMLIVT